MHRWVLCGRKFLTCKCISKKNYENWFGWARICGYIYSSIQLIILTQKSHQLVSELPSINLIIHYCSYFYHMKSNRKFNKIMIIKFWQFPLIFCMNNSLALVCFPVIFPCISCYYYHSDVLQQSSSQSKILWVFYWQTLFLRSGKFYWFMFGETVTSIVCSLERSFMLA